VAALPARLRQAKVGAMSDLVAVACFAFRPEALVARALLESEGLYAFVPDLNILGADFDPAFSAGGYRVLVRDDQLERARDILRDAQAAPAPGE
jgi:Putative prokaryotic signal transducing protein